MQFLVKSIGSTVLGILGSWLGGFIGFGTGLYMSIIFSVVGWYLAKYLFNEYLC